MSESITINGRRIGEGEPVYVIAEMSGNHGQSFDQAVRIIEAAKRAGADAVKLQTYTPDTLTIDCANDFFRITDTPWAGRSLYELYGEAYTPWEWQPRLKSVAEQLGLDCFSTPFDASSVDFLEQMDVPAYKIASFENIDLPLLRRVASTGKPVILSTGMATLAEIEEGVRAIRDAGAGEIALLKCTSAYPAPAEAANLASIPHMREAFGVPVGLSDHTTGVVVPVAAVALGACIIEKHLCLSRALPGPDTSFSLEPDEFSAMVQAVRTAERAKGQVSYGPSEHEKSSLIFRRSLFVVENVKAGDLFDQTNVRSIRPGYGLHTRYLEEILGRRAARDVARGTPLSWDLVDN